MTPCIKCGQVGFASADRLCWTCRKIEDETRASRPLLPAVPDPRQSEMFA